MGISRELPRSQKQFSGGGALGHCNPVSPHMVAVRQVFFPSTVVAQLFHLKAAVEVGQGGWE